MDNSTKIDVKYEQAAAKTDIKALMNYVENHLYIMGRSVILELPPESFGAFRAALYRHAKYYRLKYITKIVGYNKMKIWLD